MSRHIRKRGRGRRDPGTNTVDGPGAGSENAPTPETVAKLHVDIVWRLRDEGRLTPNQADAALEIRYVWEAIGRGLFPNTGEIARVRQSHGAGFVDPVQRMSTEEALVRLAQAPTLAQVELNKVEATHRSLFVAGWRPFIGWICGVNLLYLVLLRDLVAWGIANWAPAVTPPPAVGLDVSVELVTALLGLGALRTVEKFGGRAR